MTIPRPGVTSDRLAFALAVVLCLSANGGIGYLTARFARDTPPARVKPVGTDRGRELLAIFRTEMALRQAAGAFEHREFDPANP
jgi:hypothetical protein